MSFTSRSETETKALPQYALIKSDTAGRIAWMSEGARARFGAAETIADAMRSVAPTDRDGMLRLASAARFTPVFQRQADGVGVRYAALQGFPHRGLHFRYAVTIQ